ncbi:hypothetical protein ABMA27_008793 [Loxostege sticticalis]|uniref:Uncharacterized protein n=1 Tax=Loxostege sticticalis TaxID=481309 RepID=A0ABR3H942_LOXSC
MNVNECLRMSTLMDQFNENVPFDHTRTLAHRIRRDYLWHNDEIPYNPKAKCQRSTSYYSNSMNADDTDIDIASDINSLLDYSNKSICFYCVCAAHGHGVDCISRLPWFCEKMRQLRLEDAARDMYTKMFQQDRPTYFRQLPWRLRRTMDEGLYDLASAVGTGTEDEREDSCVPFISAYTDCTPENQCNGCNKCMCVANGKWSCQRVRQCAGDDPDDMDYATINNAIDEIQNSKIKEFSSKTPYVPAPAQRDQDLLLDEFREKDLDMNIANLLINRNKRSTDETNNTDSIKFYHTVDEINEDTLKGGNVSGTLQAHKVEAVNLPKITRRTGVLTSKNVSQDSLHIAYNEPKAYDPHLADNKIEADHHDDQYNTLSLSKIHAIIGNHTQKQKDKELSKLIVNELKPGQEIIGDKSAKIMSNITFTPENDTLTAMAFIAGNLLNKLWNMEKDSGEDSFETDVLKHEKIADLIDLFKEPLNLRQENFLKSALEHLSDAIDKNKDVKNVSLCEKIEETKNLLKSANSSSEETKTEKRKKHKDCDKARKSGDKNGKSVEVAADAITKVNNVLGLLNKFQNLQKNLNDLKRKSSESIENIKRKSNELEVSNKLNLTQDESSSLNVFGNILDKITKLLLPPKKSKKMAKNIRNQNVLNNSKDIAKKLKRLYNIDVDSSDLTPKDKLVFDYLSTIKRNPDCIFKKHRESDESSMTKTEGDILLNLSEFFKVKSFVDLVNLLDVKTKSIVRTVDVTTTKEPKFTTEMATTTISTTTEVSKKLTETKEKLKAHLKTIIDDLIEIQNAKGNPANNVSLVDVLPCIYNILNADKNTEDKSQNIKATTVPPVNKVAAIFNSLKQELLSTQTRRSNVITGNRPKSAIVWERMIKHFDSKKKLNTRRSMEIKEPKSFEELKKLLDETESGSKTYKNTALINGVPPSDRLVLLKTLYEDVKKYIDVLDDIGNSISNVESWSTDQKTDLKNFVDNAATDLNLDSRIAKNINSLKVKSNLLPEKVAKTVKKPLVDQVQRRSMKLLDVSPSYERKNIKLSRDSIINQLIKNRMELFIKLKESKNVDLDSDINYSIAKKILLYLDMGNYNLARELYKIIVTQKQKTVTTDQRLGSPPVKKSSIITKEPLVQFEEPGSQSQLQWMNQDIWLKQLSNLKSMKA